MSINGPALIPRYIIAPSAIWKNPKCTFTWLYSQQNLNILVLFFVSPTVPKIHAIDWIKKKQKSSLLQIFLYF